MMTQEMVTSLVTLVNGTPRVSSLDVAARFGKQHYNVIRDIKEICANLPESYRDLNFEVTSRDVPGPNGAVRKEPCYLLTRDGFSLLAMGFTGKEALAWKVKFIEAFNAMEQALRSQTLALPQDYSSALRALADEVDRRKQAELALTQTQEALVVAKQDAFEAKSALGFAGEYVQVKGLSWVPSVFDITAKGFWGQLGKAFSAACRRTSMPWSEVPDPIYGSVRAYPRKLADRMESIFRTVWEMDDATFREKSFKSSLPGAILGMRRYMKKN